MATHWFPMGPSVMPTTTGTVAPQSDVEVEMMTLVFFAMIVGGLVVVISATVITYKVLYGRLRYVHYSFTGVGSIYYAYTYLFYILFSKFYEREHHRLMLDMATVNHSLRYVFYHLNCFRLN